MASLKVIISELLSEVGRVLESEISKSSLSDSSGNGSSPA